MTTMKDLFMSIYNHAIRKDAVIHFEFENPILITVDNNKRNIPLDYYLTREQKIDNNTWYLGISSDIKKAITLSEFIQIVEHEAKKDCYTHDIYEAPIDACTQIPYILVNTDSGMQHQIQICNKELHPTYTNPCELTIRHPFVVHYHNETIF